MSSCVSYLVLIFGQFPKPAGVQYVHATDRPANLGKIIRGRREARRHAGPRPVPLIPGD
uniref:Uncharacterized protein n=1 Tax=Arundo donax TaxID=35708 RepID=A0A0A9G8V5_ARUDO